MCVSFDGNFNYFKLAYAATLVRYNPNLLFVATNKDQASPLIPGVLVPGGGSVVCSVEKTCECVCNPAAVPFQLVAGTTPLDGCTQECIPQPKCKGTLDNKCICHCASTLIDQCKKERISGGLRQISNQYKQKANDRQTAIQLALLPKSIKAINKLKGFVVGCPGSKRLNSWNNGKHFFLDIYMYYNHIKVKKMQKMKHRQQQKEELKFVSI